MSENIQYVAVNMLCPPVSTEQLELKMQVPPGYVWLQGDNYINSTDSRHYGPVPYALLQGKVVLKVGLLALQSCLLRSPCALHVGEPFLAR